MKGSLMRPLLKWTVTSVACLAVVGSVMVVWPGTVSLPASEPAVTVSAPVDPPPSDTDTSETGGTETSGTETSGTGTSGTSGTGTSDSGGVQAETQYSHNDHDHGTPVHPAEPEHGAGHH